MPHIDDWTYAYSYVITVEKLKIIIGDLLKEQKDRSYIKFYYDGTRYKCCVIRLPGRTRVGVYRYPEKGVMLGFTGFDL